MFYEIKPSQDYIRIRSMITPHITQNIKKLDIFYEKHIIRRKKLRTCSMVYKQQQEHLSYFLSTSSLFYKNKNKYHLIKRKNLKMTLQE